ncbi:F-box/FBD/LRR-repeat protein [Carex littledalei]|uniref:F-box/FBD/LRR-repeat protein n=1 Tax=Carex littledalei TaxID=544730 RepID=A0A833RFK2_9POAL|nr:F-box/FBD/LRR-repeat protein [Carex littledalei]
MNRIRKAIGTTSKANGKKGSSLMEAILAISTVEVFSDFLGHVEIDFKLSMDRPQPQESRVNIDLNLDYISNLPADLKEKILVKLPLKEVVRTSILSSKWIDSWTSIPNLVFEENCTESGLIKLVDQVLLVHNGPIEKFTLASKHACNEAIGRWMLILSRNGIRDLELCFQRKKRCNIINVSRFFNGFSLLHTLHLSSFHMPGFGIEKLVSCCPLLESLSLCNFVQQGCLRILAPNLTILNIYGDFHDICLETPKLIGGCICLCSSSGDYQEFSLENHGKESNIKRALGRLSNIQQLELCLNFFDYLAMRPISEDLPVFNHLTEIFVQLSTYPEDIATILCLFQNAPNIKFLDEPHDPALWESKAIRDCLFKHLEVVDVMYARASELSLRCFKSMLEFAKLVLSTAPLLEEFNIIDLEDSMGSFEMLEFFPRLSKKAKIVFVKRGDEESGADLNATQRVFSHPYEFKNLK